MSEIHFGHMVTAPNIDASAPKTIAFLIHPKIFRCAGVMQYVRELRLARFNGGSFFGRARWVETRSGKIRPIGPRRMKAGLRRQWRERMD